MWSVVMGIAQHGQRAGRPGCPRSTGLAPSSRKAGSLRMLRFGFPVVQRGGGHVHFVPARITLVNAAVVAHVDVAVNSFLGKFLNFGARGINVPQVDWIAVLIAAQGLLLEIKVHAAGQRVGHHQRWGGQEAGAHLGMDAAFKVAVA